jgi:hypothetical protein
MVDLTMPRGKHEDERRGGLLPGNGRSAHDLVLRNDHIRVAGLMDDDVTELVKAHWQSRAARLSDLPELFETVESTRLSRLCERCFNDNIVGPQTGREARSVAQNLFCEPGKHLARARDCVSLTVHVALQMVVGK